MKRITLTLIVALMGIQMGFAQYTEKMSVIALGDFTGRYADILRTAVTASAAKCRINVTLVNWNEVKDTDMAASVNYILSGSTGEISVKSESFNGTTYYSGTLPFSLTMMDATSGQVIDSRSNNRQRSSTDRQTAVNDCAKLDGVVSKEYNGLIYKNCSIRVPVLVIQDVSRRGIVETVVVNGGSDIGICDGLTFDVQMESEIAGKKIYKTIGEAKVKEILSGEVTLCQITKGGKEITKVLDDDITVVLTSNTKETFGEAIRTGLGDVIPN
jgi:hypothetical protein